jgi:hypothetical protein
MMHHYVLTYDTTTQEWKADGTTEEIHFPDGTIYDPVNDEWHKWWSGDGQYMPSEERLSETITNVIEQLNNTNQQKEQNNDHTN